jgi:hypothetical protein
MRRIQFIRPQTRKPESEKARKRGTEISGNHSGIIQRVGALRSTEFENPGSRKCCKLESRK